MCFKKSILFFYAFINEVFKILRGAYQGSQKSIFSGLANKTGEGEFWGGHS